MLRLRRGERVKYPHSSNFRMICQLLFALQVSSYYNTDNSHKLTQPYNLLSRIDQSLKKVPYSKPILIGTTAASVGYFGLSKTPFTNRRKIILMPRFLEQFLANVMYKMTYWQYKSALMPSNDKDYLRVSRVVNRLLIQNYNQIPKVNYTLHVINQNVANAFVFPNGKIFVFKGLLKYTETDDQLAAILGHEIGHVVGRHFAEKSTFSAVIHSIAAYANTNEDLSHAVSVLLDLKYSRTMEYEADEIGLHLMTTACYDPIGAVQVWTNFEKSSKSTNIEFLSTHPTHAHRKSQILNKIATLSQWRNNCLFK